MLGGLAATFFLGGWHGPFLPPIDLVFNKNAGLCLSCIWLRGTLPRLRYDQLMHFSWKVLTPLALLNILATGWFIVLTG